MAKTFTAPELQSIIEDIGKRLGRIEARNPIGIASTLFGGALSANGTGGVLVQAITVNGPGGGTVLVTPKLGDLVPTGVTAIPSWESGLLVGTPGSSVVDVDWQPATGVGEDQIVAWQVRLQIVGDPFSSTYQFTDHPQRIRNLKPGAQYTLAIVPIDQFGNITNYGGATTTFTAAYNTAPPQWHKAEANLNAYAGYTTVTVTWADDKDDPDVGSGNGSYDIQIATDPQFTQNVVNQRVSATICTFTGLTTGTNYYVRVRALNSSGYAGSDGVQDQFITYGDSNPIALTPGGVQDAIASQITIGAVRNTQQTYLISAGVNNPATPTTDYALGSSGNFILNQNGGAGTSLARVTDLTAFDGTAISYNGSTPGGAPRTEGPDYKGLQPGAYKAVFYLKSTYSGVDPTATVLNIAVSGPNVKESGLQTSVQASQLGNPAAPGTNGNCDGGYHAVSIPLTITQDFGPNDQGVDFNAIAITGPAPWALSHVSVVPFTALVSNEITSNYIAANAIVAGKIAAGAVTAESLSIKASTPYRNLNYDFEDASAANYSLPSHWTANYDYPGGVGNGPGSVYLTNSPVYSGSAAIDMQSTQIDGTHFTGCSIASDAFSVNPGEVLTVDGWLRQNRTDMTGGVYVRVFFGTGSNFSRGDAATTYQDLPALSDQGVQVLPANTWVSVAQAAASAGGTNLLTSQDSSFENPGVGTWTGIYGSAATLSHTTAQAYIGSSCMAVTANATGQPVARTDIYAFPAGQVGRASMYVRAGSTGRTITGRIEYTDANGNTLGSFQTNVTDTSAGWVGVTASGVAPSGTTGARVVIFFGTGNVANGEIHYVDNVQLVLAQATNNQVTVPQGASYARVAAYLWRPTGIPNGAVATLTVDRLVISGAILGTQIANGTISTPNLVVGGINADRIVAGSITTTQLAVGSVTASTIAVGTITAANIAAGTITATQISTGTITMNQLSTGLALINGQVLSGSYVGGSQGWTIQQNGYAEFNNVAIRGTLYAARLASSQFDFTAIDGSVGLRINTGGGASGLQFGQAMINVGVQLRFDPTYFQMVFDGYVNDPSRASWKFNQGFVESDNFRSTGGYSLLPFQDQGTQGYFLGSGNIQGGGAPWDPAWGLQIEQRGGLYNVYIQGLLDSDARHVGLRNSINGVGGLYIDGYQGLPSRTVSYGNVSVASDARLKHEIKAAIPTKAKHVINALKPSRYKMKDHKGESAKREHLGFIAQEVLEVLPEAVSHGLRFTNDSKDGDLLGLTYDSFIPVLVQHNQEQQAEIDVLTDKVAALEKALASAK